jgi:hypothetical protein
MSLYRYVKAKDELIALMAAPPYGPRPRRTGRGRYLAI